MSKTKPAIIILAAVMVVSALTLVLVPEVFHPTYFISAKKLAQQPDSYMLIENPDECVSQAISNPSGGVFVRSLDVTEIDELTRQQGQHNFQINGDYYEIWIGVGDKFPPPFLSLMYKASLFTLPASATALLIIIMVVMVKRRNKK